MKYVTDITLTVSITQHTEIKNDTPKGLPELAYQRIIAAVRERLQPEALRSSTGLSNLRLACANADPNYGSLWFHCRRKSSDPPRRVIEHAAELIAEDVQAYAHIYLAAMIRRKAILSMVKLEKPSSLEGNTESSEAKAVEWEDCVDKRLLASPTLEEMFNPMDPTTGLVLLDNTVDGSLFVAGITELNKHQPMLSMALEARKRAFLGMMLSFP